MPDSSLGVAQAFVQAINRADLAAMRGLMTEDHTFTDALGRSFCGADTMVTGWRYFFEAFPEYWIRVDTALPDGPRVALFGEAGGGWKVDGRALTSRWRVGAAWLAEITDGRVKSWSVYCGTGWAKPPEEAAAGAGDGEGIGVSPLQNHVFFLYSR